MFTWISLDYLPKVPDHFVELLKETQPKEESDTIKQSLTSSGRNNYKSRKLIVNGKEKPSRSYIGYSLGPEWEQWVKKNIINSFWDTGGRVSYPVSDMHGAHTDRVSTEPPSFKWKINYFVDLGGDNVTTSWYKEHNHNIERSIDMPMSVSDYSKLDLIDQTVIPSDTWVLLNTSILHGVENLGNTPRRYFTIMVDPLDIQLKMYSKTS